MTQKKTMHNHPESNQESATENKQSKKTDPIVQSSKVYAVNQKNDGASVSKTTAIKNRGGVAVVPTHDDQFKVFCSRVAAKFSEESIQRLFEERLGINTVVHVALVYNNGARNESSEKPTQSIETSDAGTEAVDRFGRPRKKKNRQRPPIHDDDLVKMNSESLITENESVNQQHLGYGFVTFASINLAKQAAALQTIRGKPKPTSHRKYTFYVRPCLHEEKVEKNPNSNEDDGGKGNTNKSLCFLWTQNRCPYGNECKFEHSGDGGLLEKTKKEEKSRKKKKKCFDYRKGKCKLSAEECPFSHDFEPTCKTVISKKSVDDDTPDSEKDCWNWKRKGKCSKKDTTCPYRHSFEIQKVALAKKDEKKKKRTIEEQQQEQHPACNDSATPQKKQKIAKEIKVMDYNTEKKTKRPLSIRVFGMNYDTTENDIREFFHDCGTITKIDFPTFSDSGRSKGYCGIWFQSPNATDQAVQRKDGTELHGRWLRVQPGKMLLHAWEK